VKKRMKFFEIYQCYFENALRDAKVQGMIDGEIDVERVAGEMGAYFMGQMTFARIRNRLDGLECDLGDGLFRLIGVKKRPCDTT